MEFIEKTTAKIKLKHIFIFLILVYILLQISLKVDLKSIPGPIFGGDYYRDRGFIKSILTGYAPWEDGYYLGELQYYNYLYFAVSAFLIWMFKFNIDKFFIFFPIVTASLGLFVHYKISHLFFEKKSIKVLYLLMVLWFYMHFGLKASDMAKFLFLPASIYFFAKYELKEKHTVNLLYSGIFLGLAGLTHGSSFLIGLGFYGIYLLLKFLFKEEKSIIQRITNYISTYYSLFVSSIGLFMIYFLPLYIRYGSEKPNPVMMYGDTYITHYDLPWLFKTMQNYFFNTSSLFWFILTFFCLIGIILFILNLKNKKSFFLISLLIANIVMMSHHLITKPLFNFWVFPDKANNIYFIWPLFFCFGIIAIDLVLKKLNKKNLNILFIGLLLIFMISQMPLRYDYIKNYHWMQYGYNTDISDYLNLGDYLGENLPNNEVLLAHDETSFSLMAVSGKKVMITRRTHASYFIDIDERIKDAAIILYSNNLALQKKLLEKYSVRYFFKDFLLQESPMLTHPRFEEEFIENNITYKIEETTLNPAVSKEKGYVTEMIVIPPQNLSSNMNQLFELEKKFKMSGQSAGWLLRKRD